MRVVLSDFQISLTAHSDVFAYIVGAGIYSRNNVFAAAIAVCDCHGIACFDAEICSDKFRKHHLVVSGTGFALKNMEAFRLGNNIRRVINSVYGNIGHSKQVCIGYPGIIFHQIFRFLGCNTIFFLKSFYDLSGGMKQEARGRNGNTLYM